MNECNAVVFDLDDTLYPEIEYVTSGLRCVSRYLSEKLLIDSQQIFETLLLLFDESKDGIFNRLLQIYQIYDEKIVKECVDRYRSHTPNITLTEEVEELLIWLKKGDFKVGIITDGRPEGQWSKIHALGLIKYCESIIVTDDLGGPEFRKPSEIPYRRILEILHVVPQRAMYVGDNPAKDFIAAKKLGMHTIMLINQTGIYSQLQPSPENMADQSIGTLSEIKQKLCKDKTVFSMTKMTNSILL